MHRHTSLQIAAALLPLITAAVGCSPDSDSTSTKSVEPITVGGDRPATVYVPASLDPDVPAPLVVVLHGYGVSGLVQELYLQLRPLAEERGFLYIYPDGMIDATNKRFWNAADPCCDSTGGVANDSAYLIGLVGEIKAHYNVDAKRVFFVGHSNGGFMSYRLACDHADTIAAIASLAGAVFTDELQCDPSEPVSVLQIHGSADDTVLYDGAVINDQPYLGARESVAKWAERDGCDPAPDEAAPPIDIDVGLAGAETKITQYANGCAPGGHAELWTIEGGGHLPAVGPEFVKKLGDFLFAHPKP
jgi:polyhydroxybutyrate depolymerase